MIGCAMQRLLNTTSPLLLSKCINTNSKSHSFIIRKPVSIFFWREKKHHIHLYIHMMYIMQRPNSSSLQKHLNCNEKNVILHERFHFTSAVEPTERTSGNPRCLVPNSMIYKAIESPLDCRPGVHRPFQPWMRLGAVGAVTWRAGSVRCFRNLREKSLI